jgi:hypothetical protein
VELSRTNQIFSCDFGNSVLRMRKVEDYRNRANECRAMARNTSNEDQKRGLLQMADTWESLANERVVQLARVKRMGALDQASAATVGQLQRFDRNESV